MLLVSGTKNRSLGGRISSMLYTLPEEKFTPKLVQNR